MGDEAFALNENMMRPYPRDQSLNDKSKAVYNYRHSRARRTTENAFGILSARFRIFFTPIFADPDKIDQIIIAACILHNIMRNEATHTDEHFELPKENLKSILGSAGRPFSSGKTTRDKFKDYFNGAGAVSWQNEYVN